MPFCGQGGDLQQEGRAVTEKNRRSVWVDTLGPHFGGRYESSGLRCDLVVSGDPSSILN